MSPHVRLQPVEPEPNSGRSSSTGRDRLSQNHTNEGNGNGEEGPLMPEWEAGFREQRSLECFVQKHPDAGGPVPRGDLLALGISTGWDDEGRKEGRGQVGRAPCSACSEGTPCH